MSWLVCLSDMQMSWLVFFSLMQMSWLVCFSLMQMSWLVCFSFMQMSWLVCLPDMQMLWLVCLSDIEMSWLICLSVMQMSWLVCLYVMVVEYSTPYCDFCSAFLVRILSSSFLSTFLFITLYKGSVNYLNHNGYLMAGFIWCSDTICVIMCSQVYIILQF